MLETDFLLECSYISLFWAYFKKHNNICDCYYYFYDVSSFQLADFGDVTRKTPENQALLKIKISDEQNMVETSLNPPEKGLKVYFMFLIPLYMLHLLLILAFWNFTFRKHILSCWLFQYLRSRWYGSQEILRKFIELFFVHTHVQAGLHQFFVFNNFVRGGGRGSFLLTENTVFTIYTIAVSCWRVYLLSVF